MADRVSSQSKKKTTKFCGKFVWIIVFYFYNIFLTMHFIPKRLQLLFKDQLDQFKATRSFKREAYIKIASYLPKYYME